MTTTTTPPGSLDPRVMKLLTEYRKTYGKPCHERQLARLAYLVATKLGHIALRQGESVECARCGASGSAREVLTGPVHHARCDS